MLIPSVGALKFRQGSLWLPCRLSSQHSTRDEAMNLKKLVSMVSFKSEKQ
jgi:hypothetical protein